jgi:DNA-binding SARP family transcriptional activator
LEAAQGPRRYGASLSCLRSEDIALEAAAFDVDVLAARHLAAQPGRTELEAAANLCSGEFLEGLDIGGEEFESWRRTEASRYRDQTIDVLTRLMTQLDPVGESERAIEIGLRILRLEPLHEPAVRRLMRLYGESGRRGPAVQIYRALADALKTELDAQPEGRDTRGSRGSFPRQRGAGARHQGTDSFHEHRRSARYTRRVAAACTTACSRGRWAPQIPPQHAKGTEI